MALDLVNYEQKAREAVKVFWGNREVARKKQIQSGKADQGERASVTAGRNMDGFLALALDIIKANGLAEAEIHQKRAMLTLPGYFRPTKLWDLLVIYKGELIAAIELKSQVGPSFGNNFNNRTEEAIGHVVQFSRRLAGSFGFHALLRCCRAAEYREGIVFMNTTDDLINRYYDWLKAKTNWRKINEWVEITTPYLDRHNDCIQIYLKRQDNEWILTDDGYTLADLAQPGCEIDTPRRKALLAATLNGFGVRQNLDALEIKATEENFPLHKHNLVQAILAVNDLFYVARANVESFFFEDVALWLDAADVRYTSRVNFIGRSHYNHQFDFVVPKSKRAPERILRVINNPNKDYAQSAAFAWVDTKDVRPTDSRAFAILNDRDRQIGNPVQDALRSYEIMPIAWSKREDFREQLAA